MTAFTNQVGQLYYGAGGANSGAYTNKATFLADHPGLTLQDFEGMVSPGLTAPWVNTAALQMAVSATSGGPFTLKVFDEGYWTGGQQPFSPAPFDSVGPDTATTTSQISVHTITFVTPVNAAGFNIASLVQAGGAGLRKVEFFDGATLLHTQTYPAIPPCPNVNVFTSFIGYARGGAVPPTTDAYLQESVADNYQQESNTDIYIRE
jgi:hypothetical protein